MRVAQIVKRRRGLNHASVAVEDRLQARHGCAERQRGTSTVLPDGRRRGERWQEAGASTTLPQAQTANAGSAIKSMGAAGFEPATSRV
jgi:hypothetical protein